MVGRSHYAAESARRVRTTAAGERGEGMGAIKHFLVNYTGNFKMALLLWPVASFMLTLPILAYLYHRDGRLRFVSMVATYLTVLYVMGLGCFTLYPLPEGTSGPGITYGIPANFNPLNFIYDIQKEGLRAVFQLVFNVVFFMPLGFIAGRLLRMRFVPTVLLACATSMCIEFAQYTGLFGLYDYAYRCCDIDDVITNTLGGMLGWLCALLLGAKVAPGKMAEAPLTDHPGFVRRCVALWLDFTLIGIGTMALWLVIGGGYQLVTGELPQLPGLDSPQTNEVCTSVMWLGLFLLIEVIIPWRHDGSTPGGSFVRMTFETHPRTTGYRVLFYVVRAATLLLTFEAAPWLFVPVLTLFYLFARRMPYDYLP